MLLTARGGGYRLALPQPDPEGLVGRRDALAELRRALLAHPLVTLKGPPGVGKTRLAEVLSGEPGVALVRLDAFHAKDALTVGVAAQLEIATGREPADLTPAERLAAGLEALAPTLLVLDNAEHIRDGARDLVASLLDDPHLDVPLLVTSQVALDLPGEARWWSSPRWTATQRAPCSSPGPTPPPSGEALDAIVEALDGLPLAIELASQWGAVVPWGRVPELLGASEPTLSARLQAARSLLPEGPRRVLDALASFADTVTFDDLQAVAPGAALGLRHLLDASLVQRIDDRYRLLAPVRRFVREHGTHRAEADAAHHTHLARLAEDAVAKLPTRAGPEARRQLAQRLADLSLAYAHHKDGWLGLAIEEVPAPPRRPRQPSRHHRRCLRPRSPARRPPGPGDGAHRRASGTAPQRAGRTTWWTASREDADPQRVARARVAVSWSRYRTEPDPDYVDATLEHARRVGAEDAERMATFLVSSHAVRTDMDALRDALPVWERIVDDLEALEAYPYALRAAVSVASTWASFGDVQRFGVSLDTFARLLEAWPDAYYEGSLHNLRAYQYQDEGDYDRALEAFEAMRRIRCGRRGTPDAVWLKNRAMTLLDAGRVAEAERDLELAAQRLGSLPHIHSSALDLLTLAYLDQGEVDRAMQVLDQASVEELTGVSLAYHQESRGIVYAFAGRVDDARAIWGRTRRRHPRRAARGCVSRHPG